VSGSRESSAASESNPGDGKCIVISLRCGRLANRLVLFANFLAWAKERNYRLVNFTFHSYADLFSSTQRDFYCGYPPGAGVQLWRLIPGLAMVVRKTRLLTHIVRSLSRLNDRLPLLGGKSVTLHELPGRLVTDLDDPDVQVRIQAARLVFAYGWRFRAPNSVRRHHAFIQDYFRPRADLESPGAQLLASLRRQAGMVIGVHIRRGDYRTWKQGQFFFSVAQYAAWMRQLAGQMAARQPAFFVCGDEPRVADEFPGCKVAIGLGPAMADLYALAQCDYVFGPPSTFSQWASYYGQRPLLHVRRTEDSPDLNRFRVSDLSDIP
jgi:hypothetical protein